MTDLQYDFRRYLAAKQSLDERSLNRGVIAALQAQAQAQPPGRILELGAGMGSLLPRLLAWGVPAPGASYLGLDADAENVAEGRRRLPALPPGLQADLQTADALEFCRRLEKQAAWDLLAAHAFLDLFHLPAALPVFLRSLRPGGLAYFSLNFDGETALEPILDPAFDRLVIDLYHRSMDERTVDGQPAGDSRSGRHLFGLLAQQGLQVLAAGSSDWVVYPQGGAYLGDEGYFLHHILFFFEQSLSGRPELPAERFAAWLQARHAQVARGELVFLAHQLDFLARQP